ncbi:response regulator [Candidatus Dependentiae bacterium]|nr:response regulator [Candidatus Dependentiae bacterium]
MNTENPLILILDDEETILQTLKDALVDEAYQVETLRIASQQDGHQASFLIGELIPDLILLDIFMPNCNGLQLLTQIKKEYPDQKIMIISGFGTIPIAIEAVQKGAIDFIEKPLNLDEILSKIDFLKKSPIQNTEPKQTNTSERQAYNIIGESNLFLELIQQSDRLAPHQFPILIYGEYGAGKSTLAHYIHKKSGLHESQFETIDCQTIPKKICDFDAKTIFLKNIDQLGPDEQVTMLKLLKNNNKTRIIASSTRSLFHLMQDCKFNTSLFALLNKAPLEIAPLRKRPYDIPLLVNHYLSLYNTKHKKRTVFTTQSIRALRNHTWPGNICELKQVIENIVIHATQDNAVITPDKLAPTIGETDRLFVEEQSLLRFNSLDQATEAFKRNFLRYLLRKNRYDIEQVSQRLNLTMPQLKNKLLELKIEV